MPVKFETFEVNGNHLAVTRCGSGGVLIVPVHGWTCRRSHWAAQLALLAEFGEVLAVDLPGHGDSAASPPDTPTVTGLASTLADLARQQADAVVFEWPVIRCGTQRKFHSRWSG